MKINTEGRSWQERVKVKDKGGAEEARKKKKKEGPAHAIRRSPNGGNRTRPRRTDYDKCKSETKTIYEITHFSFWAGREAEGSGVWG